MDHYGREFISNRTIHGIQDGYVKRNKYYVINVVENEGFSGMATRGFNVSIFVWIILSL